MKLLNVVMIIKIFKLFDRMKLRQTWRASFIFTVCLFFDLMCSAQDPTLQQQDSIYLVMMPLETDEALEDTTSDMLISLSDGHAVNVPCVECQDIPEVIIRPRVIYVYRPVYVITPTQYRYIQQRRIVCVERKIHRHRRVKFGPTVHKMNNLFRK
jgi:hypothetical protein